MTTLISQMTDWHIECNFANILDIQAISTKSFLSLSLFCYPGCDFLAADLSLRILLRSINAPIKRIAEDVSRAEMIMSFGGE